MLSMGNLKYFLGICLCGYLAGHFAAFLVEVLIRRL